MGSGFFLHLQSCWVLCGLLFFFFHKGLSSINLLFFSELTVYKLLLVQQKRNLTVYE